MNAHSPDFVEGFAAHCQSRGLSVKAASMMLWRLCMKQTATPEFLEGVKNACATTPIPPLPDIAPVARPSIDRNVIKEAKVTLAELDQLAAEAPNVFLKMAFQRRRNGVQQALNSYITGE